MKLVCIPAYNEEKTIADIIKKSLKYSDKVIVCNDGSTDKTAEIAKQNGALVVSHEKNLGYGAAITTLFENARKQDAYMMITLDADGQHDPEQIPTLIKALKENNADVVIGSRFLESDDTPSYRKTGIKIITSASNIGTSFKVTDAQSGFRVYSKKAIDLINPTEQGWSVSTEILQKASNNGLSVIETPISISYEGKTSEQHPVPHGVSVLADTIKYVSIRHPLKFYGIPGAILIAAGIIMGAVFLDAYLTEETIFFGSLFAAIVLFLLGAILSVTAVILFSMANLMRDRK